MHNSDADPDDKATVRYSPLTSKHWVRKFRDAGLGVYHGSRGQSSVWVHFVVSLGVVVMAWLLQCEIWQWAVLLLCIGSVLALELMNSALEILVRALCPHYNAEVGRALQVASGAVLIAGIAAALVGILIFTQQIIRLWY